MSQCKVPQSVTSSVLLWTSCFALSKSDQKMFRQASHIPRYFSSLIAQQASQQVGQQAGQQAIQQLLQTRTKCSLFAGQTCKSTFSVMFSNNNAVPESFGERQVQNLSETEDSRMIINNSQDGLLLPMDNINYLLMNSGCKMDSLALLTQQFSNNPDSMPIVINNDAVLADNRKSSPSPSSPKKPNQSPRKSPSVPKSKPIPKPASPTPKQRPQKLTPKKPSTTPNAPRTPSPKSPRTPSPKSPRTPSPKSPRTPSPKPRQPSQTPSPAPQSNPKQKPAPRK